MSTYITGPDPSATSWPIPLYPVRAGSRPSGYSVSGGTELAVLQDGNDATYIQQQNATDYFRYNVGSYKLPFGARVSGVTPTVRAKMVTSNTRNDWLVFQGDHSGTKYAAVDHLPTTHYPVSSAAFKNYNGPSISALANGGVITQDDLERGLYVEFGLNTVYGTNAANAQIRVSEAKLSLTYDTAPTATLTGIATGSTINDTASPLITWDYFDDAQPQSQYQVTISNSSTGVKVYDSGLVTSADTSHQVSTNLPNASYNVSLVVYQAWSGPGGAFSSLAAATGTFTVSVLRLGVPRISTAVSGTSNERTTITVYPDVNLLNYDDSTFDRGYLPLATSPLNCTVANSTTTVRDGAGSVAVTVTNTTTPTVYSRAGLVAVQPLMPYNTLIYVNPKALTGRSAQFTLNFRDTNNTILSSVSSSVTSLAANTWNAVIVTNATAPANAAFADYSIVFSGTSVSDQFFIDDAAIWHGGGGARVNLSTAPSFETGTVGSWTAAGNNAPTLSVISSDSYSGTQCMKILATGPNVFFPCASSASFTTVVGVKYTVSGYVKLPTAGGVSSVYAIVPGIGLNGFSNTVTDKDTWERVSCTFTATTTSAAVTFCFAGNDVVAGQYFYVDAVLIEQSDSAGSYFDGNSPGATWNGTVNASTSTISSSLPVWSRGGFFETTPNLLSFDDSTFEGDSYIWTGLSNCSAAASSTTSLHGSRSLAQTCTVATTTMVAQLGQSRYLSCTPGEKIWLHAAVKAAATSRPFAMNLIFYNSAGTSLSTLSVSGTDVTTGWTIASGSVTVPASAASFQVTLSVTPSSGSLALNEIHYWDALAVYRSSYYQGYVPGFFPNTDDAPTLTTQYSDDNGVTWNALDSHVVSNSNVSEIIYDYSAKSGVKRQYRAYLSETENNVFLTSDYSSVSFTTVTLNNLWIAADSDPVGTSYNFVYDGAGRTRNLSADPQTLDIEGRPYGFSEFGNSYDGQIAITVQLPSLQDQGALQGLALTKSEVVVRDQRGRSYRGVMGKVQFTDEIWGQTGSFTLQFTGNQP